MANHIKIMTKLLLFLLAANAGLSGCETDKAIPTPTTMPITTPAPVDTCITNTSPQNLIKNASFECDGQATKQNWVVGGTSSFSQNTPPSGESWSLQLTGGDTWGFFPMGSAMTYITGQSGTNIYQLKVWMKGIDNWGGSSSTISTGIVSRKLVMQEKVVSDNPTKWTLYSLTDTITTQPVDTIFVLFTAGSCNLCPTHQVLYDLVEFKKLPQ